VGFRAFVLRTASGLDLSGFVLNRPDGTVEVTAEGPGETLEKLLDALRLGPIGANVRRVESEFGEAVGEFDGFDIRY
jgi:acylphosphatase